MTWAEILEDEKWEGISDKVELDENGKVCLTAMNDLVRDIQRHFLSILTEALSDDGQLMIECAIALEKRVISPDIAYASDEFVEGHEMENPFTKAPELCIEILKESLSPKELDNRIECYFKLGAKEVWTINSDKKVQVYDIKGPKENSIYKLESFR